MRIAERSPGSSLPEAARERVENGRGEAAGNDAGSRTGPATAAGGSKAIDLTTLYFSTLYERVRRSHDYPRRAQREEIDGTVLLSVRIDRRGRVASCRVRESSGSAILDRHAVRTIRRAAPFGAVPEAIADSDLDFDLPLEYKLR